MSKTAFIRPALLLIGLLTAFEVRNVAFVQQQGSRRESQVADQKVPKLFQEALLYKSAGLEKQRLLLKDAAQVWRETRQPDKAALALIQIGHSYIAENQYLDGLHFYKQALAVKLTRTTLREEIASEAYLSIGRVYAELCYEDLAIENLRKALHSAQRIRDRSTEAVALKSLANLLLLRGDRQGTLGLIARSRLRSRQDRDETGEAALLQISGHLLAADGRREEAGKSFSAALAIYNRTFDVEGQVKALCSISKLLLKASDLAEALRTAGHAVEVASQHIKAAKTDFDKERQPKAFADRNRARDILWRALLARARAERASGNQAAAASSYLAARNQAEACWWLSKISTEALAIGFREEVSSLYQEYVDLLVEQNRSDEAFQYADWAKARAIRSMTEARRRNHRVERSPAEIELAQKLSTARTKILVSRSRVERASLQNEIRELEDSLSEERLLTEVARSRDRIMWSNPISVDSLKEKMASDNAALLEFNLGETRSFVWCITADGVWCEILPSQQVIENALRQYFGVISLPPNPLTVKSDIAKVEDQSAALWSMLLGKLGGRISAGRKLIIVPDGILHYLPFETLMSDGQYLVIDHEISYVSSAGMLGLWSNDGSTNKQRRMELLAFGDPELETSPLSRAAKSLGIEDQLAGTSHSTGRFERPALPRTRDEVEYLASLFSTDRCRVYVGKSSTEKALKQESLRDYRRIHFAIHSLIDEINPARSAVMLSLDGDEKEDGVLELGEISELDLDCDLVVLSACQTARGKLYSGEGIVGLSRAFIRAGAQSVAVSLWNVSDITTSRFMKEFYRRMASGAGNAASLRRAKLEMISDAGASRHPYYWAPFVLIGKP